MSNALRVVRANGLRFLGGFVLLCLWVPSLWALTFTEVKTQHKAYDTSEQVTYELTVEEVKYHFQVDVEIQDQATQKITKYGPYIDQKVIPFSLPVAVYKGKFTVTALDMDYMPYGDSITLMANAGNIDPSVYVFHVTTTGGNVDPFNLELPKLQTGTFDAKLSSATNAVQTAKNTADQLTETVGDMENPLPALRGLKRQTQAARTDVNTLNQNLISLTEGNVEVKSSLGPFGFTLDMPEASGFILTVERNADTLTATNAKYGTTLGIITLNNFPFNPGTAPVPFANITAVVGSYYPSGNYGSLTLKGTLVYHLRQKEYTVTVTANGTTLTQLQDQVNQAKDNIWNYFNSVTSKTRECRNEAFALSFVLGLIAGIVAAAFGTTGIGLLAAGVVAFAAGVAFYLGSTIGSLIESLGDRRTFLLDKMDQFFDSKGKKLPD